jgi:mono/diheme cytochrome c family protein
MRVLLVYAYVLMGCLGLTVLASRSFSTTPCWCWSRGQGTVATSKPHPVTNEFKPNGSYGSEVDWNNPDRIIALDDHQAQGKRIFYEQCVWCHADSTPAGPSNRSNITPTPPLMNDGSVLNGESDASLKQIITQGGSALHKSAMMPPYGASLSEDEINDLISFIRALAVPEYHAPKSKYHWFFGSKPS